MKYVLYITILIICVLFAACGRPTGNSLWIYEDNEIIWHEEKRIELPDFINSKHCKIEGENIYAINLNNGCIWIKNIDDGSEKNVSIDEAVELDEETIDTFDILEEKILLGTHSDYYDIIIRSINLLGGVEAEIKVPGKQTKASKVNNLAKVQGHYYALIGSELYEIKDKDFCKISDESFVNLASNENECYAEIEGNGKEIIKISANGTLTRVSGFSTTLAFISMQSAGRQLYSLYNGTICEINFEDSTVSSVCNFVESGIALGAIIDYYINSDTINILTLSEQYEVITLKREKNVSKEARRINLLTFRSGNYAALLEKVSEYNSINEDVMMKVIAFDDIYSQFAVEDVTSQTILRLYLEEHKEDIDLVDINMFMDWTTYAKQDFFYDVSHYVEISSIIDKSNYFSNIYDAGAYAGKQYFIPYAFLIESFCGRMELGDLDAGILLAELLSTAETHTEQKLINASNYKSMETLVKANIFSFVDMENVSCDFETKVFVDLLKICKELSYTEESFYASTYENMLETNSLIGDALIYSPESIENYINKELGISLLNIISDNRISSGVGILLPENHFAIMNNSHNKSEAWAFVEFLNSDYDAMDFLISIPANSEWMNKRISHRADNNNGKEHDEMALSETEKKVWNKLVNNVHFLTSDEKDIISIVLDEAECYFFSTRSAEETARIINSRVKLYLMEKQ